MMHVVALLLLAQAPLDAGALDAGALDADARDAGPPPIAPRVVDDAAASTGPAGDAGPGDTAARAGIPNLTLSAAIEPSPVVFGEPFALVVTIVRERGLRLQMPGSLPDIDGAPRMQRDDGAPLEERRVEELPRAAPLDAPEDAPGDAGPALDLVRETLRVPYLALDTEPLETPAFVLTAKDGLTVDVPSLKVQVVVPPEPPDAGPAVTEDGKVVLAPNAGSIAYAVPDARPWVALAALLSAGLLYAGVRAVARRRRLRPAPAPAVPLPPPRPAHETALERLEALLASGMLARGETAPFVERLMDEVLRDYITARFALSAGTRTTRELVQDLLGVTVAGLDVQLVESLLADADLVKFAKATIAPERAHAMATRVRTLIEATAPAAPEGRGA